MTLYENDWHSSESQVEYQARKQREEIARQLVLQEAMDYLATLQREGLLPPDATLADMPFLPRGLNL